MQLQCTLGVEQIKQFDHLITSNTICTQTLINSLILKNGRGLNLLESQHSEKGQLAFESDNLKYSISIFFHTTGIESSTGGANKNSINRTGHITTMIQYIMTFEHAHQNPKNNAIVALV